MRILVALFVALFAVTVASAQDATDEPTPEATPEPYTLAEEVHQLDFFIGSWDVQSRLLMDADTDEWMEETVTSTVEPIIGGFALLEHFDGTYGGTPIQGVSLRIYNSSIGKWQQRWTDNTSPGFAAYTGQFADGQFIAYADRGYSPEVEGGMDEAKQNGLREIFFDIEPDRFSWRLESTSDGGETWTVVWTLEYTRTM
jgi:hypothetical protein